jgi:hypothetical protein
MISLERLVEVKEKSLSCCPSQNTRSQHRAIHYGCMAGSAYCCAEARPEQPCSMMWSGRVVGSLGSIEAGGRTKKWIATSARKHVTTMSLYFGHGIIRCEIPGRINYNVYMPRHVDIS